MMIFYFQEQEFSTLEFDKLKAALPITTNYTVTISTRVVTEITKAITLKSSLEPDNLELLELLGDSFLKIVTSMHCYVCYGFYDEGRLSKMRSSFTSNKNLFDIAIDMELHKYIITKPFLPCKTIVPGYFSCASIHYFGDYALGGKRLSDVVEAIIGAWLVTFGYSQAVKMTSKFLGVSLETSSRSVSRDVPQKFYCALDMFWLKLGLDMLEKKLQYKFKDKSLLLEAVSHPTAYENSITPCYQRLEFLGDAVIDFLVTRHLYVRCKDSNPGLMTDMRSALVSNTVFASVLVLNGLHKHMFHNSPAIFTSISNFIQFIESFEKDKINWDEVCWTATPPPKILADVFESIAGAIFIDSDHCFATVWKIYSRLYGDLIEHFMKDVPVNPVRFVHENSQQCVFKRQSTSTEIISNETVVICTVNNTEKFVGVGENFVIAKRRAAMKAKEFLLSI